MHAGTRFRKRLGHVALFVALAVVPVLALNSFATADTAAGSRPGVTDAQRQCLADHGVTRPTPGSNDQPRSQLSRDDRKALKDAADACGLHGPKPRVALRGLSDAQRQCLANQGVTLQGGRRNAGVRAALEQAADTCGLPMRGSRGGRGAI